MSTPQTEDQKEAARLHRALHDLATSTKDDLYALLDLSPPSNATTTTAAAAADASPADTSSDLTESQIRASWRRAALKHHPDKNPSNPRLAADRLALCRSAYDILRDPVLKGVYDNRLRSERERRSREEAFEGKRRRMKEELERRESGSRGLFGGSAGVGVKRGADGVGETEAERRDRQVRRLAEEGRRRREGFLREREERERREREEDVLARLERKRRGREEGEKTERKGGGGAGFSFTPPGKKRAVGSTGADGVGNGGTASPGGTFYEATMRRLKEAERKRVEERARREDAAAAVEAGGGEKVEV